MERRWGGCTINIRFYFAYEQFLISMHTEYELTR